MKKCKKLNFCWDQEGHKSGDDICFVMFLCVCKANFFLTPHFFILELILVLWLQKKNSGRIIYTEESNLSSECEFGRFGWYASYFCSRWKRGHMTDSEDTLQTRDWANSGNNMASHLILSLGFEGMSPSQGHVWDMSRTFPTKFLCEQILQDLSNAQSIQLHQKDSYSCSQMNCLTKTWPCCSTSIAQIL